VVVKGMVDRDPDVRRVIGVDSSSTGIAWTLLEDGLLVDQDKIRLDKLKTVDAKLACIYTEFGALVEEIKPDYIFIEKSIFVRNPATARLLSYVVGSLIAVSAGKGFKVHDVEPSTWKAFFGYRNLSSKFVQQVKNVLGNKDGKKFCDEMRKSQTWNVIKHNYDEWAYCSRAATDHDIADSWGVALWGYSTYGTEVHLDKSSSVSIDQAELARLGLSL
jgi:Holliday junction resolvasome RuvABC endonuclease subunit